MTPGRCEDCSAPVLQIRAPGREWGLVLIDVDERPDGYLVQRRGRWVDLRGSMFPHEGGRRFHACATPEDYPPPLARRRGRAWL